MKTARCFLRIFVLVVIVMPTSCRPRSLVASDPTLNSVSESGSWQIYGYDLGESFFSPETAPPPQGEIVWCYARAGGVFTMPLLKDGTLYVMYGVPCAVAALDADTGEEIWAREFRPDCLQAKSLSLAGNMLYVTVTEVVGPEDSSQFVYALDKDSGATFWRQETCSSWPFFVSQGLGYLISFPEAVTSCEEKEFSIIEIHDAVNGEKLKELSLSYLPPSGVPLSLFDEQRIYLRQDEYIYALAQKTYERVWEKRIAGLRGATIIEDTLYVGGREAFLILDTQTGEELRRIEHPHTWGSESVGISAVAYGMILTLRQHEYPTESLYALSLDDGNVLWERQIEEGIETPLTIANGRVYFGNTYRDEDRADHGKLYALDIATGEVMWVLDTPPIQQ